MGPQRIQQRSKKKHMANSKLESEIARQRERKREKNNERDCVCTAKLEREVNALILKRNVFTVVHSLLTSHWVSAMSTQSFA